MWDEQLIRIDKIEKKYGGGLLKPALSEEIEAFKKGVQSKFRTQLPEQFITFLQTVNGLHFNGVTIYGVDAQYLINPTEESVYGFIETNEIWHENEEQKNYLFFGDSDMSWYCLNLSEQCYELQDKPSGTTMETYDDFDALLEAALEESLG